MIVVLKNIVPLPHYPHAVVGQSGITHGHAMFDARYNAHVFRLPYEEWAGEKGKDIVGRAQGSMNRYHVLIELFEGSVLAPETPMAPELGDALARVAALEQDKAALVHELTTRTTEPADRRITEAAAVEAAAQDSALARALVNEERGVDVQVPVQGFSDTPGSVDEAAAGFLAATKRGVPLEEKRVETNPETGKAELVERVATPAASGMPQEPVGEKTDNPYVNVRETRTPLDPATDKSGLVAAAENTDATKPVLDTTVRDNPEQKEGAPVTNATDGEGNQATDDLDANTNFRSLRKVALDEGCDSADVEKITTATDMRALIRLNRESKTSEPAV